MFSLFVVLGSSLALFGGVAVALTKFEGGIVSRSKFRNSKAKRHDRLTIPGHEGDSQYGYYYDL